MQVKAGIAASHDHINVTTKAQNNLIQNRLRAGRRQPYNQRREGECAEAGGRGGGPGWAGATPSPAVFSIERGTLAAEAPVRSKGSQPCTSPQPRAPRLEEKSP